MENMEELVVRGVNYSNRDPTGMYRSHYTTPDRLNISLAFNAVICQDIIM
jgi:hypothetical protein